MSGYVTCNIPFITCFMRTTVSIEPAAEVFIETMLCNLFAATKSPHVHKAPARAESSDGMVSKTTSKLK